MPQAAYAQVNEDVQAQEPLLRVTTGPNSRQYYKLAGGKPGSLQTAAIMASLVRDAAVKDKALEIRAAQILVDNGLDSHSDPFQIADALLRYTQKLTYIHDPAGAFDSVQSAQQVLREGKGDCDDLAVLLATLLALVGFKPRFVLAKYREDTDGFDHVYVDLELPQGRVPLDPTSRKHGIGWESPRYIDRVAYPIFDGKVIGLGEIAAKVKKVFHGMRGVCSGNSCETCQCGEVSQIAVASTGLSFPALVFGLGFAICALKVFDSVTSER